MWGRDSPAPTRSGPALSAPPPPPGRSSFLLRGPHKPFWGGDPELGLGFECSRMTSKGDGWGWRLVTGATQGGPTCPTRSGPVLHPPSRPEHHNRSLTATPPTRDAPRAPAEDLRQESQNPGTEGQVCSQLPTSQPGTHLPPHAPVALPIWGETRGLRGLWAVLICKLPPDIVSTSRNP